MCCVSRLTRRQAELAAQEIRESGVVPGSERMEPAERRMEKRCGRRGMVSEVQGRKIWVRRESGHEEVEQ